MTHLNYRRLSLLFRQIMYLHHECIDEYWQSINTDDIIAQLNHRQKSYLMAIARFEPCTLNAVIERTKLSKSAASTAVSYLVKLGLVIRRQSTVDRRELELSIAPELHKHFHAIDEVFNIKLSELFQSCSDDELQIIRQAGNISLKALNNFQDQKKESL